ncbi:MAG: NAD(P)-dependent oxidoreductase [Synergistaceae bacterium]|nr:NAD(P)-dependent oxidoreductase [Synergistaceae bacterium]
MSKILITGGTGFIGSHIVEYFREMGEDIRTITRQDADLRDADSVLRAINGADCVIHNAALAADWGRYGDFYDNNVTGTLNVLKACVRNGVGHVIVASSCSVYGEEDCSSVKDENSHHNSHYTYFMDRVFPCAMNYYRDTKRIAKEKAIEFSREHKLPLALIEPVWVYGEREFHTGFYDYLKAARDGLPFCMGSRKNKFHVVYARDLARAYYLAYKAKAEGSFIIGNREVADMEEIFSLFCSEAGVVKPRRAPKALMYPIGFVLELLWTVFGAKKPPFMTRGRVNIFYDSVLYGVQKAKDVLGFESEYTLAQGIKNTVSWYKKEGYL